MHPDYSETEGCFRLSEEAGLSGVTPSAWYLSPVALLRDAIKQVPSLRYALGVGGIAAVVAIVLFGWKVSPWQAIVGTLIVLIFMVVLVIFAALARAKVTALGPPAIVMAWSFLLLTVSAAALFVSCAFFNRPKELGCLFDSTKCGGHVLVRTASDNLVLDYMDEILVLRGDFEAKEKNPGAAEKVKVEGKRLAAAIESVADSGLNTSRRIIKHEYAGWALLMVSRTYPKEAEARVQYAREAVTAFDKALKEMELVKLHHADGDQNATAVYDWMTSHDSEDLDRTLYLKAISLGVLAQSGAGYSREDVRKQLERVSDDYRQEYPVLRVEELAWANRPPNG